ncbi:MAG TPA: hypothetical protein VGH38_36280, partial [Bryobacteraceae bacterium]
VCWVTLALAWVLPAAAQTDWRKIGGYSVELMLAAPATGPVDRVWFSADGSVLYARTLSGKIFQTANFETWAPAAADVQAPPRLSPAQAARLPEPGANVVATPDNRSTIFGLGRQLFRSDDEGRSWMNLTAFKSAAVVGTGQHAIALPPTPADRDQLVVANDYGVWRSMDGGRSWSGLNQFLPNLSVKRILSTPSGVAGTRVQVDRLGTLELPPGGSVWHPTSVSGADDEAALIQRTSAVLQSQLGTAEITAAASAGTATYAGASDGRVWVSINGAAFVQTPRVNANRVERIFVDPTRPQVALVALSGTGGAHVLRTTNYGYFWDALDGNLPDASVRGITADRAAGALYVATDKGIFWTHTDLDNNSSNPVNWTSLSDGLPSAAAADVRLDPAGVQLYAALDGYGVYAVAAPHRLRNIRIVNAADYSTRAAAPGGLLSVIGGKVSTARGGNLDYPVLAVLGNESQIQVPFEAVGPSVALALQTANGPVMRDVALQAVSPGILVGRDGTAMLWDADSGLPLDVRSAAHSNGRLQIWATGLGKVQPRWPTGMAAPMENPPAVEASVSVYLDRSPIQVTRATLLPGYIGFYLIEVQLPAITNAGTSELYISADGQDSNRVQVTIEP